jgi:hypothetical protein
MLRAPATGSAGWRPVVQRLQKRCDFTHDVGPMAYQCVTARRKNDGPPVSYAGGNQPCRAGGAELIVLRTDRKNGAGNLLDAHRSRRLFAAWNVDPWRHAWYACRGPK